MFEFNHTSWVLLYRGDILIAGGRGARGYAINTAFQYDFASDSLTHESLMRDARDSCALVLWYDVVLAFGGLDGVALRSAEVYSLENASWHKLTSAPKDLGPTSAIASKDIIYVSGRWSDKVFTYAPKTGKYDYVYVNFHQGFRVLAVENDALFIMTRGETWRVKDNMGTKISSVGYDSVGSNNSDDDWNIWPKGTPAHFEGRVIFNFEDGTVVEYNIPKNQYRRRRDFLN